MSSAGHGCLCLSRAESYTWEFLPEYQHNFAINKFYMSYQKALAGTVWAIAAGILNLSWLLYAASIFVQDIG